MRSKSAGLTLVEVLVVIGIILVLGAIASLAWGPIKVKALEQQGVGNLRSFGQAIALYAADNPVYDEVPGLGDIPIGFGINLGALTPYGLPRLGTSAWFSPMDPMKSPERRAGSYTIQIAGLAFEQFDLRPGGGVTPKVKPGGPISEMLLRDQDSFGLIVDDAFDKYYYWPRDQNSDPFMLRMTTWELCRDLAVRKKVKPGHRALD